MWINDDIGSDTFLSEWHVFLRPDHGEHTFLTVTRTELVTDNWISRVANGVTKAYMIGVLFVAHKTHRLNSSGL